MANCDTKGSTLVMEKHMEDFTVMVSSVSKTTPLHNKLPLKLYISDYKKDKGNKDDFSHNQKKDCKAIVDEVFTDKNGGWRLRKESGGCKYRRFVGAFEAKKGDFGIKAHRDRITLVKDTENDAYLTVMG